VALSIKNHRLLQGGEKVPYIGSPYIGSTFSKPPKIMVVHFTYGASARSSAEWFRSKDNKGSSAHIVIDRDGSCLQCVDLNKIAWHAGDSRLGDLVGLNKYSLGIELANWGYLKQSGSGWTCYTGLRIDHPLMAVHRNGNPDKVRTPIGWESYPEEQFIAAAAVAKALVDAYGIDQIVGHDEISVGRKWDPGPAFDMSRFRARVFGDREQEGDVRCCVAVQEGLNLRSGPGTDASIIELLPDGTVLEPIEESGNWMCVSVIGSDGRPHRTGWVHSRYVARA
jgi:N-acetylmuramoyl-L-alanine amidase